MRTLIGPNKLFLVFNAIVRHQFIRWLARSFRGEVVLMPHSLSARLRDTDFNFSISFLILTPKIF
jgi:hypothetical protein